ncbi:MAG: hypothetical protein RM338_29340 [Nostoc sp. DedQUE12a]|nr:hypothetical protein [Nostoc sp. DedQUE12a]
MICQDFFDDKILEKRVNRFYGYGNYQGNYWFIGMEEAGGDFQEINNRINIWSDRGEQEIEDIAEFHKAIGYGSSFEANANLDVPVWNKLIRILLSAKGQENIHIEDVRKYQINELGRNDKETCLLELLPLPSPNLKHWIYNEHSQLSYLCNRESYENYCLETRINHLSERIKECHQLKAVIYYGIGYESSWREITKKIGDVDFLWRSEGFFIGRNAQTVFVIAKHPATKGLTNEYFHKIGISIAEKLAE